MKSRPTKYKKRVVWKAGFVICIVSFLAFIVGIPLQYTNHIVTSVTQKSDSLQEKTDHILSNMTDEQKIGQLIMIGVEGTRWDHVNMSRITDIPFGNIILFDRNMDNPEQVKKLTGDIQKTAHDHGEPPVFIALDQEGGQVRRMRDHMPAMPSAKELGENDPEETEKWAEKTGQALINLGIQINFAPVADLGLTYDRSYGENPSRVIVYAESAVKGYAKVGIISTMKHFPGIGKVKTDPHIDRDIISSTWEEMDQQDAKTFRKLIKNTDSNQTWVMVSNVSYPAIDQKNPACFSAYIMKEILRDQYSYQGIIVTDDMDMGAISNHYDFQDVGVKAIQAGADIVLICQNYDHAREAYEGLLRAYHDGGVNRDEVDQKVGRIIRAKIQYGKF